MKTKTPGITVRFSGYGHWKITTTYYGREINIVSTNSIAVDDYKDDDSRRSNRGEKVLRAECIRRNKIMINNYFIIWNYGFYYYLSA